MNLLKKQNGMTLLEIIIVVTILGSLIAILGTKVATRARKAKVGEARIQISELSKNLEMYNTDCGHYPTAEQGFAALAPNGGDGCANWGPEPYIKKAPVLDPWGQPYIYLLENGTFTIISYGEDHKEGGSGYNTDISSND
jgi:general secretion pathway protein G